MTQQASRPSRCVLAILIAIAVLYFIFFAEHFIESLELPTILIAPIMALGSFVAGSTFLGGGAVAFPALTKLLSVDALNAKTFSLAIQSVGMSAASLYIIVRVKKLPWAFIGLYLCGSFIGINLALSRLQEHIAAVDLRISFSLFLLCFLIIFLLTQKIRNQSTHSHLEKSPRDISLTIGCGFLGGITSGLLGSGADLIAFSLLALYFRLDIKLATQTSVIIMAASAIFGFALQAKYYLGIDAQVWRLWYVAAPVVLFGAPFGAAICRRLRSSTLVLLISAIVSIELSSTFLLVPIDQARLALYGSALVLCLCFLLIIVHQAKHKHTQEK
ncbi:sulfite exporter TauE/SafE family protein [Agaribacterium sp. ZY112]|uniref:sulfite exporter TauE/SafE family protein n=1 Tax=Agaribacterium sp. ZY112 TaxID=3233574 RepID=UPI0035233194